MNFESINLIAAKS